MQEHNHADQLTRHLSLSDAEEEAWLENDDVPMRNLEAIRDEFGSAVVASVHAYRDGSRLEAIDGIGPKTLEEYAAVSPMNAPGEWTADLLPSGGFEYTADGAVLRLTPGDKEGPEPPVDDADVPVFRPAPDETEWRTPVVDDGGGPLLGTWQIELEIERDFVSAWWAIRNVMEQNPQGPDSDVPRNVAAPDDWTLITNRYTAVGDHKATWKHESGVRVMVHEVDPSEADADADELDGPICRLAVAPSLTCKSSEREELGVGTWADCLEGAESALDSVAPE